MGKTIIVRKFPLDKPELWNDVYNTLLKYDTEGKQEQFIDGWIVKDNKTNITITYALEKKG
jgi:hypothetical protein